jgi:hypothetical protein
MASEGDIMSSMNKNTLGTVHQIWYALSLCETEKGATSLLAYKQMGFN